MNSGFDDLERVLVAAAERLDRFGLIPGPAARRPGGRLGLAVSLAVTLAIAAGAVLVLRPARVGPRSTSGSAAGVASFVSYRDPDGWSFRYPVRFRLDEKRFLSTVDGPYVEVTVASFRLRDALVVSSNGLSAKVNAPRDLAGRFPANGVAFRLQKLPGGRSDRPPHSTRPPISLSTFSKSSRLIERDRMTVPTFLRGRFDGDTRTLIRGVRLGHRIVWTALVWIGPLAPPPLRHALQRTIASLTLVPAHRKLSHG